MSKPTEFFNFDRNETNLEAISSALKLNGLGTNEVLASKTLNGVFKQLSDESLYFEGLFGKEFYVSSSGSDDNDGLTSSTAFATLKHAIDSIEEGGFGTIIPSTDLTLNETIEDYNKTIFIKDSTATRKITVTSNTIGTEADTLNGIKLYGNSKLFITPKVVIEAGDFDTWQAVITSFSDNYVFVWGGIEFESNSATNKPCFLDTGRSYLEGYGKVNLFTYGDITTNDSGYVIGERAEENGGSWSDYSKGENIDNLDYCYTTFNRWLYETGKPYDGSDDTFQFGGVVWDSGTYTATSFMIDVSNSIEDFFDAVYGDGEYTEESEDSSTALSFSFKVVGKNQPMPLQIKSESTGSWTTYTVASPQKLDFIRRNF